MYVEQVPTQYDFPEAPSIIHYVFIFYWCSLHLDIPDESPNRYLILDTTYKIDAVVVPGLSALGSVLPSNDKCHDSQDGNCLRLLVT